MNIVHQRIFRQCYVLFSVFLVFLIIAGIFPKMPVIQAQAITDQVGQDMTSELGNNYQNNGYELVLHKTISDWKMDEETKYVYAISKQTNSLMFIRPDNLEVEKEIFVGSEPNKLELVGDKLYITLRGTNKIVVVNTLSQAVENSISVTGFPYYIAVDGNKLFYTSGLNLYEYDLQNQKERKVDIRHAGNIVADSTNHILYVGETGGSGSNIYAYSTEDFTLLNQSTYDNGYGFSFPKKVILDGKDIFYAGRCMDKDNLAIIHGQYKDWSYSYEDRIFYVNGDYVFSDRAIFDRETYVKIDDLPVKTEYILMDSNQNIFVFDTKTQSIKKIPLKLSPQSAGNNYTATSTQIILNKKITDWEFDEENNLIYAVAGETNSLLFIRLSDFQVEEEIFVGSKPSDIDLFNGKLYIALSGSTQIAVVNVNTRALEQLYTVNQNPYRIAVDGTKLFYVDEDQHCQLYVYEIDTEREREIPIGGGSQPDIAVDTVNHILYVGESGSSGSDISAISTLDYTVVHKSNYDNGYGFYFPARKVIINDANVFYAERKFDAGDLTSIHGIYQDESYPYSEQIYYVNDNYVFSTRAVYDREKFIKIAELPFSTKLILMDKPGNIYLFNEIEGVINKVTLGLNGNKENNYQTNDNQLILGKNITDWVIDETNQYIFALASETNTVLKVRLNDLQVEKEIFVGSNPSDIELVHGKLYVALLGSTQITVVNAEDLEIEKVVHLSQNPARIAVDGNKLFFVPNGQHTSLYEYDLIEEKEKIITVAGDIATKYYLADIVADRKNHILYIAESSTPGYIEAISTVDYTRLHKSYYDKFHYPGRKVILDGTDVFYAGHQISAENVAVVQGKYSNGDRIYYVNGTLVFSGNAVYERETFKKITDLPFVTTQILIDDEKQIYVFDEQDKSIKRIFLDLTSREYVPLPEAKATIKTYGANVRVGPGLNYHTARAVYEGETFTVIGKVSNWHRIKLNGGFEGYISASLVKFLDEPGAEVENSTGKQSEPKGITKYIVQAGDTLKKIADKFFTTVEYLVDLNKINDPNMIYVGQELLVPIKEETVSSPETSSNTVTYVVKSGDTLGKIAQRYGLTVNDIVSINKISDPNMIDAGQELLIPMENEIPQPVEHIVQNGETLWLISQKYGVAMDTIVKNNNLSNPDEIFLGQKLVIE